MHRRIAVWPAASQIDPLFRATRDPEAEGCPIWPQDPINGRPHQTFCRALELLAFAEETIAQHGLLDGCLRGEGAVAIAAAVAAFDQHRASEGSGTGTV